MSYSIAVDRKWQERWDQEKLASFNPQNLDKKLYVLEMFSYPSGAKLHIGHWYNYSLADSFARFKKMQGYEVFQPMGFDAFGLPAENYAIKTGIHPKDSTEENIATMKTQLREMGGMFNWDHTLATCDPEYYRWNQWLFLQLYKKGLAYRKKAPVNWCPSCNTVLANEQVMADGTCERCGSQVEKKHLTQWFFNITAYAQELLDCLPDLNWPEPTKKIQENWIGRSEGSLITFKAEKDGAILKSEDGEDLPVQVFTTRADTLLGVTYIVVAPDSDLCDLLTTEEQKATVQAYQEAARHKSDIDRLSTAEEKTGVFSGSYAIHPLTGERVPIWVGDYVIASYGSGVVMAVPAHDERDFAFAHKHNLPIKRVIKATDGSEPDLPFVDDGILMNSGAYDGLDSASAREKITSDLASQGRAEKKVNYRLRDWLVSRQRYWGTPIPIVYCDKCGMVPVPEEDLPVELPYNVKFTPHGDSPLKSSEEFMHTTCPCCGGPALRDPDTLDTFVDSTWYMFRYVDNHNQEAAFAPAKVNALCPVDVYVGGKEHAAMHLLYSRFITKALRDMGYLNFDEPFTRLIHQGVILGPDGQKMSKSKGNTISPDEYVSEGGSDLLRLYLAFGFAFTEGGPWSDNGIKAISRFIRRVETLVEELVTQQDPNQLTFSLEMPQPQNASDKKLLHTLHYTIDQVTQDADRFQFNTSLARIMELLNELYSYKVSPEAHLDMLTYVTNTLILILAPFAPHLAEELGEDLGSQVSLFRQPWPKADPAYVNTDEVEIAIQVNGKIFDRVQVPSQASREEIQSLIEALPAYAEWLDGRKVVKFIVVPGRLVNLVVK